MLHPLLRVVSDTARDRKGLVFTWRLRRAPKGSLVYYAVKYLCTSQLIEATYSPLMEELWEDWYDFTAHNSEKENKPPKRDLTLCEMRNN